MHHTHNTHTHTHTHSDTHTHTQWHTHTHTRLAFTIKPTLCCISSCGLLTVVVLFSVCASRVACVQTQQAHTTHCSDTRQHTCIRTHNTVHTPRTCTRHNYYTCSNVVLLSWLTEQTHKPRTMALWILHKNNIADSLSEFSFELRKHTNAQTHTNTQTHKTHTNTQTPPHTHIVTHPSLNIMSYKPKVAPLHVPSNDSDFIGRFPNIVPSPVRKGHFEFKQSTGDDSKISTRRSQSNPRSYARRKRSMSISSIPPLQHKLCSVFDQYGEMQTRMEIMLQEILKQMQGLKQKGSSDSDTQESKDMKEFRDVINRLLDQPVDLVRSLLLYKWSSAMLQHMCSNLQIQKWSFRILKHLTNTLQYFRGIPSFTTMLEHEMEPAHQDHYFCDFECREAHIALCRFLVRTWRDKTIIQKPQRIISGRRRSERSNELNESLRRRILSKHLRRSSMPLMAASTTNSSVNSSGDVTSFGSGSPSSGSSSSPGMFPSIRIEPIPTAPKHKKILIKSKPIPPKHPETPSQSITVPTTRSEGDKRKLRRHRNLSISCSPGGSFRGRRRRFSLPQTALVICRICEKVLPQSQLKVLWKSFVTN